MWMTSAEVITLVIHSDTCRSLDVWQSGFEACMSNLPRYLLQVHAGFHNSHTSISGRVRWTKPILPFPNEININSRDELNCACVYLSSPPQSHNPVGTGGIHICRDMSILRRHSISILQWMYRGPINGHVSIQTSTVLHLWAAQTQGL